MMRSISRPSLHINSAGMLCTRKRAAVTGFWSTLSLATRTWPENSAATSSTTGASWRQRPAPGSPHLNEYRQERAFYFVRKACVGDLHWFGIGDKRLLAASADRCEPGSEFLRGHAIRSAAIAATHQLWFSHSFVPAYPGYQFRAGPNYNPGQAPKARRIASSDDV